MNKIKTAVVLISFAFSIPPCLFAEETYQEVVVNPGDTMWSIANKYLKDPQKWPEIVKLNTFLTGDPTNAIPGSKIKIPILLIKEEFRTAQLMKMIPEVRVRRKGEQNWMEAKLDMTLKYEDSLRTMKGAQARVKFPTKEVVQINENSLVILKPEKILQEVQLLEGEVRASRAKVIMPNGTVVRPQSSQSDYQAKVREDKSEVVFVYKGEVNVTAQGKTIKVKEGFGTHVPKFSPPSAPQPLNTFKDFNPADLTADAPNTSLPTKDVFNFKPPPVKVNKPTETGQSKSVIAGQILTNYHVQISKDQMFREIVLEKTEKTEIPFDIRAQKIPDGSYYMRVAFMDALGTRGAYSAPNLVVKDVDAPELINIVPKESTKITGANNTVDISGQAKGASMVSVNGNVVFLGDNGSFLQTVFLKEGLNKITIIAKDLQGNKTIVKRDITYSKN